MVGLRYTILGTVLGSDLKCSVNVLRKWEDENVQKLITSTSFFKLVLADSIDNFYHSYH